LTSSSPKFFVASNGNSTVISGRRDTQTAVSLSTSMMPSWSATAAGAVNVLVPRCFAEAPALGWNPIPNIFAVGAGIAPEDDGPGPIGGVEAAELGLVHDGEAHDAERAQLLPRG
jgi:hypothetical protein